MPQLPQQLIAQANDFRAAIARWARTATIQEHEALSEVLVPLRYDLEELATGNYDPTRLDPPTDDPRGDVAGNIGEDEDRFDPSGAPINCR